MPIEFAIQNALGILPSPARAEHALALLRRQNARSTRSLMLGGGQTAGIHGLGRLAASTGTEDDNLRSDRGAVVKVGDIFIGHPDAAGRHAVADGPRLVGAVNPVQRVLVALPQMRIFSSAIPRNQWQEGYVDGCYNV